MNRINAETADVGLHQYLVEIGGCMKVVVQEPGVRSHACHRACLSGPDCKEKQESRNITVRYTVLVFPFYSIPMYVPHLGQYDMNFNMYCESH